MNLNNYSRVRDLYDKGFRCIKYEEKPEGELTVYLKNFEEEKIDTLIAQDTYEINQIKSFIDTY